MVAKGGAKLINRKAIQTLKEKLIKKVYLVTPNIPETELLTKIKIRNLEDMIYAANILLKLGAKNKNYGRVLWQKFNFKMYKYN